MFFVILTIYRTYLLEDDISAYFEKYSFGQMILKYFTLHKIFNLFWKNFVPHSIKTELNIKVIFIMLTLSDNMSEGVLSLFLILFSPKFSELAQRHFHAHRALPNLSVFCGAATSYSVLLIIHYL